MSSKTPPEPQDAQAYLDRGIAYYNKGEWDNAIADFGKAIGLNTLNAEAYFNRGAAYYSKGEWDKAIGDYDKAIELNPKYADAYINRAFVYYKKGKRDKVIADLGEAIKLNPEDAGGYINRGFVHFEKKEWSKAIKDYSKALQIGTQDASVYINRGLAYLKKEERSKAFIDFVDAVENDRTSKSRYAEVYVASIINDAANNGGNPAVIAKHAVVEIFSQILTRTENIQNELFYEQPKPHEPQEVAHYTSLDTLKHLVNEECFRLYNSAYMNDPEEGRVFFDIMNKWVEERARNNLKNLEKEICGKDSNISYRSPAYIGSFIPVDPEKSTSPEKQKDKLPLWRMYGKQRGEEAAGSCLIFLRDQFAKDHRLQIGYMNPASLRINLEKKDSEPSMYKIAYADTEIITKLRKDFTELASCLGKVEGVIKNIPDDTEDKSKQGKLKQLVRELLDSIRFLFKATHYKEENEVRVLELRYPQEKSDEIKVDAEQIPPRFYLETPKSFCFSEVILGPKARHSQEWEQWIKEQDPDLEVRRSGIEYGSQYH